MHKYNELIHNLGQLKQQLTVGCVERERIYLPCVADVFSIQQDGRLVKDKTLVLCKC